LLFTILFTFNYNILACRPKKMVDFFKQDIAKQMTERQRKKLNETPFAHLLEMPQANISDQLLTKLVDIFDLDRKVFMIHGESVPFTVEDVALVLGKFMFFFFLK
jgi:hypothetical protein